MSPGLGVTQRAVLAWLEDNDGSWAVWWIAENLYGDPAKYDAWTELPFREQRREPKPIHHTPSQREAVRRAVATLERRSLVTAERKDGAVYVKLPDSA